MLSQADKDYIRERRVVDCCQWIAVWAADLSTGRDEVDEAFLRKWLPYPNQYIDGPASPADLKKFFIATLQGALKMLEQVPKAESPEWKGISAKDRTLWFGIAHEGMEAPWLSGMGACLVKIWDIRRREDGVVEYGIGNETKPEPDGIGWITADKFFDEWPQ